MSWKHCVCFFAFEKREAHVCQGGTFGKQCNVLLVLLSTPCCYRRCLLVESDVLWSSQSLSSKCGFTSFISADMIMCTYVIHTVTWSTRCFWQLGCKCEYVHIFVLWFIFLLSIQWPCHTLPGMIVHPVNCTPCNFFFPGSFGVFSLMTLEAVAKTCEL